MTLCSRNGNYNVLLVLWLLPNMGGNAGNHFSTRISTSSSSSDAALVELPSNALTPLKLRLLETPALHPLPHCSAATPRAPLPPRRTTPCTPLA
ncbi:hypothetical protein KC19_2G107400 [Ceratodon purpureus]|uniref:Secreted protein n=1 Tax=Ceratodon purpureus TaxID=3225 RepID=A0A8T0ISG4_CERPU|nr:hypothetical protein KC19_2G107400 [Ceratodon purpureus]